MVETQFDVHNALGLYINVPANWTSFNMGHRYQCFLGQLSREQQGQFHDSEGIEQLISEHNKKNKDSLRVFYWDDSGKIIFGQALKGDSYDINQLNAISVSDILIFGDRISNLHMTRAYTDKRKKLIIQSPEKPVLQMLNCFDDVFNLSLTEYFRNMDESTDKKIAIFFQNFGKQASNPILSLYYKADNGIYMKRVEKRFNEKLTGDEIARLDITKDPTL